MSKVRRRVTGERSRVESRIQNPEAPPKENAKLETQNSKPPPKAGDSAGGAMQRTTALFEVLTERKSGSAIEVVQFNRKS